LGFDPIWYGVLIVIVAEVGMITPPVGLNVFLLSGITGTPINRIFRGVWPFVAVILVSIVIMTIFPQIVLWLPGTM
jgi:TRAP-type C4-dicarboxylate transport system permease large subunit